MLRRNRFSLLFIAGLILMMGLSSMAFASGNDKKKKKQPKNTGVLAVTTTPRALPVRVDGQMLGVSGVGEAAEFYLTPGIHLVEVEGPNGQIFRKEINVVKNVKNCICLDVVEKTSTRPCPYDMEINGPSSVKEGDLVTFVARNVASITPIAGTALNYAWRVTPSSARVTSGLGTPAITVDTTGLGGRQLMVELEVTDGVYDASCRQMKEISTSVEKVEIPTPVPILVDEFPHRAFDDDKARLDAFAIELQSNPSWIGYVIMYQGTDKRSQRTGEVGALSKRALDYLVKVRGVDPSRVQIVRGGSRPTTTYQFWVVPPGADYPIPN